MFDEKQIEALNAKLDLAHVSPPKKYGPKGEYIESWHAISEANRIFGFDGWSATNVMLECVAEKERKIGRDQKDGWGVTYICTRQIEVAGVVRQGSGSGHGYDLDLGLAHESAVKEAESDAEKRALRTFGNQFGLALYDKSRANVGDPEPKGDAKEGNPFDDDTSDKMKYVGYAFDMIDRKKTPDDLDEWWKAEAGARRKNGLTQSDVDELAEAFKLRKQTLLNGMTDKSGNELHPMEAG